MPLRYIYPFNAKQCSSKEAQLHLQWAPYPHYKFIEGPAIHEEEKSFFLSAYIPQYSNGCSVPTVTLSVMCCLSTISYTLLFILKSGCCGSLLTLHHSSASAVALALMIPVPKSRAPFLQRQYRSDSLLGHCFADTDTQFYH